MGYDTSFRGRLDFNRELTIKELRWFESIFEDEVDGSKSLINGYGRYCQWKITDDGKGLEWDESEKFYEYIEWLKVVIDLFLSPLGIVANGEIEWEGEEQGDVGVMFVEDNLIKIKRKKLVWVEDNED